MSDIRITKGKSRATVFGESVRGRIWMRQSMVDVRESGSTTYTLINVDEVDEVAKYIVDEGIEVEIYG